MTEASQDLSETTPLNGALAKLLQRPELRDELSSLINFDIKAPQSALPIRLSAETPRSWLAGPRVVVTLARAPAVGRDQIWLALPLSEGSLMVDRVLGGEGREGIASASGRLSDAECGVLAYAAARCCAAAESQWSVLDVECSQPALLEQRARGGVLWPLSISLDGRNVPLSVVFPPGATLPQTKHALSVVLSDAAPNDLPRLAAGDVLTSDRFVITPTARGLEGSVWLSVDGCSESVGARVERGSLALHASPPASGARSELRFVLDRKACCFGTLAALSAGVPIPMELHGTTQVRVQQGAQDLALGELVHTQHGVGVRVQQVLAGAY